PWRRTGPPSRRLRVSQLLYRLRRSPRERARWRPTGGAKTSSWLHVVPAPSLDAIVERSRERRTRRNCLQGRQNHAATFAEADAAHAGALGVSAKDDFVAIEQEAAFFSVGQTQWIGAA